MSGHSKWATIHRQKEVKDAKRGAAFTKLGNAITIAVREGGGIGDPDGNFKLRLAMEKARSFNMPKENIQRAIDKAVGGGAGETIEQVMYEGFGPGGAAVMIEAATDNRQRTINDLKHAVEMAGGTLGSSGSVGYMFERKGYILVPNIGIDKEDLAMKLIDLGVEDVEVVSDGVEAYCDPHKLMEVKKSVEESGLSVSHVELVMKPSMLVQINSEEGEKLAKMIESIEDLDDVQKVYTNADIEG